MLVQPSLIRTLVVSKRVKWQKSYKQRNLPTSYVVISLNSLDICMFLLIGMYQKKNSLTHRLLVMSESGEHLLQFSGARPHTHIRRTATATNTAASEICSAQ